MMKTLSLLSIQVLDDDNMLHVVKVGVFNSQKEAETFYENGRIQGILRNDDSRRGVVYFWFEDQNQLMRITHYSIEDIPWK